jgi:hypothetical protein
LRSIRRWRLLPARSPQRAEKWRCSSGSPSRVRHGRSDVTVRADIIRAWGTFTAKQTDFGSSRTAEDLLGRSRWPTERRSALIWWGSEPVPSLRVLRPGRATTMRLMCPAASTSRRSNRIAEYDRCSASLDHKDFHGMPWQRADKTRHAVSRYPGWLASPSSSEISQRACSIFRPRCNLDLTVPTGHSRTRAISL